MLQRDLVDAIARAESVRCRVPPRQHPAHRITMFDISLLGFEVLEYPAYSPNLAPMDFNVFLDIKADIRGRKLDSVQELRRATMRLDNFHVTCT